MISCSPLHSYEMHGRFRYIVKMPSLRDIIKYEPNCTTSGTTESSQLPRIKSCPNSRNGPRRQLTTSGTALPPAMGIRKKWTTVGLASYGMCKGCMNGQLAGATTDQTQIQNFHFCQKVLQSLKNLSKCIQIITQIKQTFYTYSVRLCHF